MAPRTLAVNGSKNITNLKQTKSTLIVRPNNTKNRKTSFDIPTVLIIKPGRRSKESMHGDTSHQNWRDVSFTKDQYVLCQNQITSKVLHVVPPESVISTLRNQQPTLKPTLTKRRGVD